MQFRTDLIRLRRGQQFLSIRRTGRGKFVGYINGRECVIAESREAAISNLLRRAANSAMF